MSRKKKTELTLDLAVEVICNVEQQGRFGAGSRQNGKEEETARTDNS